MPKHLRQHLAANPHIETVYHNGKGEWQFHKRAGYDQEIAASDVIENGLPGHEDQAEEKGIDQEQVATVLKLAQSKIEDAETEAELAKEEVDQAKSEAADAKKELAKLQAELAALKAKAAKKGGAESDNQNSNA